MTCPQAPPLFFQAWPFLSHAPHIAALPYYVDLSITAADIAVIPFHKLYCTQQTQQALSQEQYVQLAFRSCFMQSLKVAESWLVFMTPFAYLMALHGQDVKPLHLLH